MTLNVLMISMDEKSETTSNETVSFTFIWVRELSFYTYRVECRQFWSHSYFVGQFKYIPYAIR